MISNPTVSWSTNWYIAIAMHDNNNSLDNSMAIYILTIFVISLSIACYILYAYVHADLTATAW